MKVFYKFCQLSQKLEFVLSLCFRGKIFQYIFEVQHSPETLLGIMLSVLVSNAFKYMICCKFVPNFIKTRPKATNSCSHRNESGTSGKIVFSVVKYMFLTNNFIISIIYIQNKTVKYTCLSIELYSLFLPLHVATHGKSLFLMEEIPRKYCIIIVLLNIFMYKTCLDIKPITD